MPEEYAFMQVIAQGEGSAPKEVIARQCALLRGVTPILAPSTTSGAASVDGTMTDWALEQVYTVSLYYTLCVGETLTFSQFVLGALFFHKLLQELWCVLCTMARILPIVHTTVGQAPSAWCNNQHLQSTGSWTCGYGEQIFCQEVGISCWECVSGCAEKIYKNVAN